MALIKDRKLASDSWLLPEAVMHPHSPGANVIVPLALWRTRREELLAGKEPLGVLLAGGDEPAELAPDLQHLQLVAVYFKNFADGRGFSIARLLRERYGWRGELRAVGDVQRDQLFYLMRCGFDSFDLRPGEDVDAALLAFKDFGDAYQASFERPLPLFRRREAAVLS